MKPIIPALLLILITSCENMGKDSNTVFRDTANIFIRWGNDSSVSNTAAAYMDKNKISLILDYNRDFSSGYSADLQNISGHWNIISVYQYSIPNDCLYVASKYIILNQSLQMNKSEYQRNDLLTGNIDLKLLGKESMVREPLVPFVDNRTWDSIQIKGFFSVRLK